jgi:L-seryl-tRNA(Ser) seleniumtransferase
VLADPRLVAAVARVGRPAVKQAVVAAQEQARSGALLPAAVADAAVAALPSGASSLGPVINATGVLLHTNLGRAPLSAAATEALVAAAGPTAVELDLSTGRRTGRALGVVEALAAAVPDAEAVHVVNNGAAALVLAATALAAGREIVISRGELVEIGDGFRLPDLLTSTGATLREVGTTNRTALADYRAAVGGSTGFVLKVHPSNFVVTGFTSAVGVAELSSLEVPVVADVGSGLLAPHSQLPDEPDAASALRAGADLVIASGDKLLGGPQCGLILGRAALVHQLRRHPLARALRCGKLTLAALEATLRVPPTPTAAALATRLPELSRRADALATALAAAGIEATAAPTEATVGGGGAPGVPLRSAGVLLPEPYAARLRGAVPPVMTRVAGGHCVVDLLAVPPAADESIVDAIRSVS